MKFLKHPNYARIKLGAKAVPLKVFKDSDKDTVPNFLDCQPFNPRKQGEVIDYTYDPDTGGSYVTEVGVEPPRRRGLGDTLRGWGNRYKSWKKEKEQKDLEKLTYKTEKAELKSRYEAIRNQRALGHINVQRQRLSLMQARQKAMGPMPSMFGPGMFSQPQQAAPKQVHRRHRRYRVHKRRR